MCQYRKILWLCNHANLPEEPYALCSVQRDYIAGETKEPCDQVITHSINTVRVNRLCDSCGTRKAALDKKVSNAKTQIVELKQQLDNKHGDRFKKAYGIGLEAKDEKDAKKLDPVAEFLRMKRNEKHSAFMMLGS
ncbi:hypothetical protein F5Y09DRAFT_345271 [Xylaria sp. FL1042]|nr:hypothetical protein F5Y09DRAFT_345271 [Xylaria sp. FL1042]